MAVKVATLFVDLRGSFQRFQADVGKLDKTFASLGKTATRVGKTMSLAFTAPLAGIGTAAAAAANQMDDAFDAIRSGTGATGKDLEGLTSSFKEVLSSSTQSVGEVGKVIADLNTGLGLTGKPLEDLSKQVLDLSRLTGSDLNGSIAGTTKVMNAWKVSVDKQGSTMDFLFKTVQATGANFGSLTVDLAKFQPVLSQIGFSLQESAALFAQLDKAGANASQTMMGFQFALARLSKAGVKDISGALKLTFKAIEGAPDTTTAAARAIEVFGQRAGPQLAGLIRQGKLSIDEFVSSMEASQESIGKATKDTDGFSENWARLKNNITLALEPIGTPILEGLSEAIQAIIPHLKAFGEWFGSIDPEVRKFIVAIGATLAVLGPLILAFGQLLTWAAAVIPAFSMLAPVMTAAGVAIGLVAGALALLLTPLGLVAAAVGVAIAAWYKWDVVGPYLAQVWDDIKAAFVGFLESFKENLGLIGQAVVMFKDDTVQKFIMLKDEVLKAVGEMINGITDWFTGKFEGAKQSVATFADEVKATFQGMYMTVVGGSIVPDMVTEVGQVMSQLPGKMLPPTQQATQGVVGSFDQLLGALKKTTTEGVDEGKKLAEQWAKVAAEITSITSDITATVSPLRQEIGELLKAKDFDGLNKLAEGFKGSKAAMEEFRGSLRDAKGDFQEWSNNQDRLHQTMEQTKADLYEIGTGKKYIDQTTQSILDLMRANDMVGLEELASEFYQTSEGAAEFDKSLQSALGVMREMGREGQNLGSTLGGPLSSLFQSFGLDSKSSDWLGQNAGDLLGGLFGGGGGASSSGSLGGMIGSAIGSYFGSGSGGGGNSGWGQAMSNFASMFGGSGGGSSAGGGWMSAIGSMFGGGGTSGIGPVANGSQYADMLGGGSGMGGGWAAAAQGLANVVDIMNSDFSKFGAKKNEKKARAVVDTIGMAVADYWTFGLASVVKGVMGEKNFNKMLKILDPVGQTLIDETIQGLFGQNPETYARRQVRDWMNDQLKGKNIQMIDPGGTFDHDIYLGGKGGAEYFNKPGWADEMNASPGAGAFNAVGQGITGLLGVTEDIGGQIGYVLFKNMGGSIDNLRILVQGLGLTMEQMTQHFVSQAEKGQISWFDMEVALQGVNDAFGEGLAAVGDFGKAFDIIVNSGGEGMDAILGLKNSAIEAAEAGLQSFEQWRQGLLAQGKSVEYVDALFQALAQRGITSFEQLQNASNRELGGVIADMQAISPALMTAWTAAQEAIKGVADTIKEIPNPTDIQINVDANISDDARKAMSLAGQSATVASPTPFATGGIVKKPVMGMVGEAGPEAILPLSRLGGMMRKVGDYGGGGGSTYNIDARNAAPGVEADIMRAIDMAERRAVEAAVIAVADMRDRGGSFADSF